MKKWSISLAAVILFGSLPSAATAQPVAIPLCVNNVNVKAFIEFKGAVGSNYVFQLSGYIPFASKDIVIDGTVLARVSNSTLRFGLTLQNSVNQSMAVNWEFVTNFSLFGTGESQLQVGDEVYGNLVVAPGVCPAHAVVDSATLRNVFGIVSPGIERN
jgi:hypothetical protein